MENVHTIQLTRNQAKIFRSKKRNIIAITGRRFGKTHGACSYLAENAIEIPNSINSYIGLTYAQAKNTMLPQLLKVLPAHYINQRKTRMSTPITVTLRNNSQIILFGGQNENNMRGYGFNSVVIDEIADQKPSLLYDVIMPTLIQTKGKLMCLGTPRGKFNWTNELINNPDFESHAFGTIDGGLVEQSEIDKMRLLLDDRTFRQEILGEIIDVGGSVYYEYGKTCYSDEVFSRNRDTVISFDFNVNPMTATILQKIALNKWVAVKEFTLYNSNTPQMCQTIKNYLINESFAGYIEFTGDFAGMQRRSSSTLTDWAIIEEQFRHTNNGFFQRKIRPTLSIKDRVSSLNYCFHNDIVKVNPNKCEMLSKDLFMMDYKENSGELNDHNGKHGHWSDNLSYFALNYFPIYKIIKDGLNV